MAPQQSKVSQKLAKRDVLMMPGGRSALMKRPASVLTDPTEQTGVKRQRSVQWAKVVAPAYISGSLMHPSPIAYTS